MIDKNLKSFLQLRAYLKTEEYNFLFQLFVLAPLRVKFCIRFQKLRVQILYTRLQFQKELIRNKYLRFCLLRKGYTREEVENFAQGISP